MKKEKDKSIEELFQALNGLVTRLDTEEIGLEQSFALYQEGVALIKSCNDKIDMVEKQILVLNQEGRMNNIEE